MRSHILTACLSLALVASASGAILQRPSVSAQFFNPAIGQSAALSFELSEVATVTARVLDRDGVAVRTLASSRAFPAGPQRLSWDGRDDAGAVVPNEAWSFRLDVVGGGKTETYFPADRAFAMTQIKDVTYDRAGGVLRYTLPSASRVHLQAGVATADPVTKAVNGPVLRTVVNREPRSAGAIIEQWNGLDESGTIHVPDLPNFVVAVAVTPLPENSVITVGSRGKSFVDTVAARKGESLFTARHHDSHAHHTGLTSLQDVTPRMDLKAVKHGEGLTLKCDVTGPAAGAFAEQGGALMLFVDGRLVRKEPAAKTSSFTMSLESHELPPGPRIVAVNWVTPNGPTAANASRVLIESN